MRIIQGFFPGGARLAPSIPPSGGTASDCFLSGHDRAASLQRGAAVAARPVPGHPPLVHASATQPVQRRAAPGRPPLIGGAAYPVQRRAVPGPPPPVGGAVASAAGAGKPVQRFGGDGSFAVDPARVGLVRSGGAPLPGPLLAKMEAAFGADFSAVRIHVGPQASRIGALAFTTGSDLYFAPGQYQPDSVKGQQLIGHELAHVIQQRQGRVRAPGGGVTVVQDRALEAEADRLGMKAAAHRMPVQRAAAAGSRALQRSAMPGDLTNYTQQRLRDHDHDVGTGADQIALPIYGLDANKVVRGSAHAIIVDTVDIANRSDAAYVEQSMVNIETQAWNVTKQMHDRVSAGHHIKSHRAKQTEVVGEAAALNAMLRGKPRYRLKYAVKPGHGAGIDQLWKKKRRKNGVWHTTYLIVEAKGPGQGLAKGQMTRKWAIDRIGKLSRSGDARQQAMGAKVAAGLATKFHGTHHRIKVKGRVATARWDDASGTLRHTWKKSIPYNY